MFYKSLGFISAWMFYRWHIFTPHLRWEVKALLAPQDGKGETEVEGGVHDVHVLVESHQVLLPVVLEAHQHHVGAQLAKTGQSHARLGTAHKVGGLWNVLGFQIHSLISFQSPGCKSSSPWCCGPSATSASRPSGWPCSPARRDESLKRRQQSMYKDCFVSRLSV